MSTKTREKFSVFLGKFYKTMLVNDLRKFKINNKYKTKQERMIKMTTKAM